MYDRAMFLMGFLFSTGKQVNRSRRARCSDDFFTLNCFSILLRLLNHLSFSNSFLFFFFLSPLASRCPFGFVRVSVCLNLSFSMVDLDFGWNSWSRTKQQRRQPTTINVNALRHTRFHPNLCFMFAARKRCELEEEEVNSSSSGNQRRATQRSGNSGKKQREKK